MPIVSIRHRTTYRYRNPVAFGDHHMMLRPAESFDQRLLSFELSISPTPNVLRQIHDLTGAPMSLARFDGRSSRLTIESRASVDHYSGDALALERDDASLGADPFEYQADEAAALADACRSRGERGPEVEAWARRFVKPIGRTRLSSLLVAMTHAIRSDFAYELRREGPPQSPEITLARKRGSCRDFAMLQVEAARQLGLAALFVTGYIYSGSAKETGPGHGHTHAWVRVYVPGCGWIDFDPTNGIVGNAGLIRVAAAADHRSVVPLHGSWRGLGSDFLGMDVEVEVAAAQRRSEQPATASGVALTG